MSVNVRFPVLSLSDDKTVTDAGVVALTGGCQGDCDMIFLEVKNASASKNLVGFKIQILSYIGRSWADFISLALGGWNPALSYADDRLLMCSVAAPDTLAFGATMVLAFRIYGASDFRVVGTADTGESVELECRGLAHGAS